MKHKYSAGTILILFVDDKNAIIHQNKWDLTLDGSMPAYSIGDRIELHDVAKKFIGTIEDVKHWISADDSGNFVESLQIKCGKAYAI